VFLIQITVEGVRFFPCPEEHILYLQALSEPLPERPTLNHRHFYQFSKIQTLLQLVDSTTHSNYLDAAAFFIFLIPRTFSRPTFISHFCQVLLEAQAVLWGTSAEKRAAG
jgi:hypothetical protein